MNWKAATITELYTIAAHEECAQEDKWMAAHEIAERMRKKRIPYRKQHMKVRKALPRW